MDNVADVAMWGIHAGQKGERGEKGEAGPRIVGCEIDRASYTLTLILSDKSKVALQVRGLFEQYHDECGA